MNSLLIQTYEISKKQWQLILLTICISLLSQITPTMVEMNFAIVLILLIPGTLQLLYSFSLLKLIQDKKNNPKLTLQESLITFLKLIPKLFLRVLSLLIISVIAMGIVYAVYYAILQLLNLPIPAESNGSLDLRFIFIGAITNLLIAAILYQPAFYFLEKQPFYKALISSIRFAIKEYKFTFLIALIYLVMMIVATLIGSDQVWKRILNGILYGLEMFVVTVAILLYFIKNKE